MYICLCNALTERRLKQAAGQGCERPCDVYAACGCRAQCGQCVKAVLAMLRDNLAPSDPAPAEAHGAD